MTQIAVKNPDNRVNASTPNNSGNGTVSAFRKEGVEDYINKVREGNSFPSTQCYLDWCEYTDKGGLTCD